MSVMSDVVKIGEFLREHHGERRYLADWCADINKLGTRKKYTKRELAFVFNKVMLKEFVVERLSAPSQYAFVPLSL